MFLREDMGNSSYIVRVGLREGTTQVEDRDLKGILRKFQEADKSRGALRVDRTTLGCGFGELQQNPKHSKKQP